MEYESLFAAALLGVVACSSPISSAPAAAAGSSPGGAAGASAGSANAAAGAGAACGNVSAPSAWSGWVMPNPPRSRLPNPMSYTVSPSDVEVTDNVTGLIWQRDVPISTFTWADANQYCACLTTGGEQAWRLPSRIELSSIADWSTAHPSIDQAAFPDTPSDAFWSSSVLENGNPDLAWHVDFDSGHTSYTDKLYTHHARCVRGGAADSAANTPPARYTIQNGTVYDTQTKLSWQQALAAPPAAWAEAAAYCAALSLAGTGWRVPSIAELQTLVNEARNPAVDDAVFPMTPSEYFWSSSAVADDPTRAWDTFFANGSTYSFALSMQRNVRCVR